MQGKHFSTLGCLGFGVRLTSQELHLNSSALHLVFVAKMSCQSVVSLCVECGVCGVLWRFGIGLLESQSVGFGGLRVAGQWKRSRIRRAKIGVSG